MKTLGIIAGKGDLPKRLINICQQQKRPFFVLAIEGNSDAEILKDVPHAWVRLGAIAQALAEFRAAKVEQLVMVGRIERPNLASLRPDTKGLTLIARLGKSLFAGDDRLLSTIIAFLEEEGFEIVGVDEILEDIIATEGLMGKIIPDRQSQADIEIGARVAKTLGKLDIGQAVIVQQGHILGVEALEGTDKLIARCAELKVGTRGGVLVKVKKPYQEQRVDLPAIGVQTVYNVAEAGFLGIAVEAGGALVIDRAAVEREANRLGVFVIGFTCGS